MTSGRPARSGILFLPLFLMFSLHSSPAATETDVTHGRDMLHNAFELEVQQIENDWFSGIETLADWEKRRSELRQNLAEMLGLWPTPPKTDLNPTITGIIDNPGFTVEKLRFESLPGLYVTASLYLPKHTGGKPPVVLYLNGHGKKVIDGISYGNKVNYQHNPIWYARQGLACLIIDTLDHGEIEGVHHGTFSQGRWWWYNRGYTPGAIELWNTIRGIDYLETRDEIDTSRIGTTGRSGGGMYSWLILALDDRVTTGTPTAGLTDLRNHLIDGVIRGHCDCNYWNNFHRIDTTVLAALAAPRPVRLLNSDTDNIFPTSGIRRIEKRVAKVYALYGKEENWSVYISKGRHKDTRELQLASYPFMYRWLTGTDIGEVPETGPLFEPAELKVFSEIPADEINTSIDQVFIPKSDTPEPPANRWEWEIMKANWMTELLRKSFAGWPESLPTNSPESIATFNIDGIEIIAEKISPQPGIELRIWSLQAPTNQTEKLTLRLLDNPDWLQTISAWRAAAPDQLEAIIGPGSKSLPWPEPDPAEWEILKKRVAEAGTLILFAPRGIGPTFYEIAPPNRGDTITRSFQMLGQTLHGMQIWDARAALSAIRNSPRFQNSKTGIEASGTMAAITLYLSLFDQPIDLLHLTDLPNNHANGPFLLNIDEITDLPQIYRMALDRSDIRLSGDSDITGWSNRFPKNGFK